MPITKLSLRKIKLKSSGVSDPVPISMKSELSESTHKKIKKNATTTIHHTEDGELDKVPDEPFKILQNITINDDTPENIENVMEECETSEESRHSSLISKLPSSKNLRSRNRSKNNNFLRKSTPSPVGFSSEIVSSNEFDNHNPDTSDKFVYNTNGPRRGNVLIFNNVDFRDLPKRKGAEKDEEEVARLMSSFGFTVQRYRNLEKLEMVERIKVFRSSKSLASSDMSILVMMSHGQYKKNEESFTSSATDILGTDGKGMNIDDVLDEFTMEKCPYLAGKPKIFIFQCCRNKPARSQSFDFIPRTMKNYSDMLIAYSTIPGYYSMRNPLKGTWYIQGLVKVFKQHAENLDIETMLKLVDRELILKHSTFWQTSSYETRGFNKRCYLNPVNTAKRKLI